MPCNMFTFTSSMTRPPLRCTEKLLRLTSRTVQLFIRLDSVPSLRSCCNLPTSSLRWLAGLIHLGLLLSTSCLISMSFVFTSRQRSWLRDRHLGGIWSVLSQLRKLNGCRPSSPPRLLKSRPSCLPLFVLKRGLFTRDDGLDLTGGQV